MLVELVVSNLVIVRQARLAPGRGLTVISGETGAGKSLLLDALLILLGGRAGAKLVGPDGPESTVTGVFQVAPGIARQIEQATGVAASDDGGYILRRRLAASGRSQSWINDVPVTVAALQQVAGVLVEIRAQHEPQQLAGVARQLDLLDAYAGLEPAATQYREAHARCLALAGELAELEHGERGSLRELEFLQFQSREFAALAPQAGELEQLERRFETLSGAQTWRTRAAEAIDLISDGERAVLRTIGSLARRLGEAPDERLRAASAACAEASEHLRTAESHCREVLEHLQDDPAELERIDERRNAWYDLMRKHGDSEADLLAAWAAVDARIASIAGLDARRDALRSDLAQAGEQRTRLGAVLGQAREKAFTRLAKALAVELADLGMPKAGSRSPRARSRCPARMAPCTRRSWSRPTQGCLRTASAR